MTSNFFPDAGSVPKPAEDQNNDDPIGPPTPVIQQLLDTEEMMRDLMPQLIAAGATSSCCVSSLQEMIRYLTFHTDRKTLPLEYLELDNSKKSHDHLVLGRLMEEAKRDVSRETYRWTLPHDYRTLLLAVCRSPLMYPNAAFADDRRRVMRKAVKNGYFRDVETYNQVEYLPTKDVGFLTNNPDLTLKALDQIRSVQLSREGFVAVRNDILRLPPVQKHVKMIPEDTTALIVTIDQRPFSTRWVAEKMVAKQPPLMVVCMDSELILPFALMEPQYFKRWLTEADRNHRSGYKLTVQPGEIPVIKFDEENEDYEQLKAARDQERIERGAMYFQWASVMKPSDIQQLCTFDEDERVRLEENQTREEDVLQDKIEEAKSKLVDAKELRAKDLLGYEFSDAEDDADDGSIQDFVVGEEEEEEGEEGASEQEGSEQASETSNEKPDPEPANENPNPEPANENPNPNPTTPGEDTQFSTTEPLVSQKRMKPVDFKTPDESIEGFKETVKRELAAKRLKVEEDDDDDDDEAVVTKRRRRRERDTQRGVNKDRIKAEWMNDRTEDSPLKLYYVQLQNITERIERSLPGVKVEIVPMMFMTLVICRAISGTIEFVDQLECDAKATNAQLKKEEEAEKKRAIREQQQREEIAKLTQLQKERQKKKMEGGGGKKAPTAKIPIPGTAETDPPKRIYGNIAQMLGVKKKVKPE